MSSSETPGGRGKGRGKDAAPAGDPATRRRICEAALRLIARRGGVDVPLAAVARGARVSRQALYLHFANRADLMMGVVRYADEKRGLPSAVARIENAPTGVDALQELVAMQAALNPSIWPLARLYDSVRRQDAAAERSWQDRMEHRLEGCRAIVRRLEREASLRADLGVEVAAELLWALTSLRTWEDLVLTRGWTAEQYQARVTDLVLLALVRPGVREETGARLSGRVRRGERASQRRGRTQGHESS